MDREGEQGKKYLDRGNGYGLARNLALGKFPRIHKDGSLSNGGEGD